MTFSDLEISSELLKEAANRDEVQLRKGSQIALRTLGITIAEPYAGTRFTNLSNLELTCELVVKLDSHKRSLFDAKKHDEIDSAIEESCGWIRNHFELHPEDRQAISDRIQQLVPRSFPWHVVRPKAVGLALLYNFSPFQDTGATVASKRIREFAKSIDVIACSFLHRKKLDKTVERIAEPYICNHHLLELPASWATWGPYRAFIAQSTAYAESLISAGAEYSFFYSRAMWAPSIYAGAEFKLQHPELKWIAEFSDPLSLDVEGHPRGGEVPTDSTSTRFIDAIETKYGPLPQERRTIFALAEALAYSFADEIIFTNENQKATMLSQIADRELRERVEAISVVSHHPTLPPPYYEMTPPDYPVDPEVLNLGYFGEFYSSRSITEVTSAIKSLPLDLREKVNLHIFTNYIPATDGAVRPRQFSKSQYDELVSRAFNGVGATGIEHLVRFNPSQPYLNFLATSTVLDYLIVNDAKSGAHHAVNPYLPSKWSDYKGSRAKTWAFVETGSVLSKQEIANTVPVGDILSTRKALWDMIEKKFPNTKTEETD